MKIHRFLSLILLLLMAAPVLRAETETTQAIADRYELLLLRTPQPGASFDRVIDWYTTKGGGLEFLQKRWEDGAKDPANRRAYLLLQGLLAERLRGPEKARAAYQAALAETGDPAQAARLLATLETTEGNFPAAAAAYTKALEGDSLVPVDRMEIMRSLALLYQRAFDSEKAVAVWRDALAKFPDDPYVLDEAGEAFLAAGDYEQARKTFSRLRDVSGSDPFRKVAASLRLARTAEVEGKTDEAVTIYNLALEETSQGSWINREVRARIEELFRRKDDLPGLLAYYEKRTAANPQDFQSLAAQAEVLEDLGRNSDSIERFRAATKLAPENTDLRLSLIRRLSDQGEIDAALKEADELARPANASPETLITLGNLYWKKFDDKKDTADRDNALTTWRRLVPSGSTDAARISQLAEILASHDQPDAAVEQWKYLITVSPGAADARQKIAEVYKKRGDEKAALAELAGLIEGDRSQPENFLTLARIQESMGWAKEARATAAQGLSAFPQDYELLNFAWRQAVEAKDMEEARKLFVPVWRQAPNEFFAEDTVKRYASFLDGDKTGKEFARQLAAQSELSPSDAAVLLRLAIAQGEKEMAQQALAAIQKAGPAPRAARAQYELAQAFGSSDDQIAALRTVATADPRLAADSLRTVARLQADSGQVDAALATVLELIQRSPADATLYTLYSDLASRAGKLDLAITQLREAVRYVENAGSLRLQLATLLQAQERTAEASKVLQEAFEKEDQDGRRLDIFRRQIELAMQGGTLDDLVASLKEKQTREQNGARYGVYLAEIAMMQGDFTTAQEELTRSLGRNPDNAAAVSKLIDLADQAGDQQESIRLSARLVELQPTRENRASYISRLFGAGEASQGLAEFERIRAEILKDPFAWSSVLVAMRKAGYDQECDRLVEEIASAPAAGLEQRMELASLRLLQRDYAGAEKVLWEVVQADGFAAALADIAGEKPSTVSNSGLPSYYMEYQPFQKIAQEVQANLQQMFLNYGGRSPRNVFYPGSMTAGTTKATPAQRAQVKAFFLLAQLSRARGEQTAFFEHSRQLLEADSVPRNLQLIVLMNLNETASLMEIVSAQAEDPHADVAIDKFILGTGLLSGPESKALLEKVTERVAKVDPPFAFQQLLGKVSLDYTKAKTAAGGSDLKTEDRANLRKQFDALLSHPGMDGTPLSRFQLAMLAANLDDLDLAFRLMTEAETARAESRGGANTQALDQYQTMTRTALLTRAIRSGDKRADDLFAKILSDTQANGGAGIQPFYGGYYGGARTANMLAQQSPELQMGDSEFPIASFRSMSMSSEQAQELPAWFLKRAAATELTPFSIGAFYAEWQMDEKDEAVKRLEQIQKANPSPRVAALLLEAYEKLGASEKALALIDTAELQKSETIDIRMLRKIRLLRAAARLDEARALAEKATRGRVSTSVRDQLANEINLLGLPPSKMPNAFTVQGRRVRSGRDHGQRLSEQINRLRNEKKNEEAERIALAILQHPLPSRNDYMETNLRWQMVQSLKSMKATDALEKSFLDRLDKDPADLDAAIRLAELGLNEEGGASVDRLVKAIVDHPQKATGLSYAIQLVQRRSGSQVQMMEAACALLQVDPDFLLSDGLQFQELMNFASEPQTGLKLAETVATMSDENYRKLFIPSRLTGQMEETIVLSGLAEIAAQGGKTPLAITLLKRASADSGNALLDQTFPIYLRLAELQLEQGRKDDAAETMKSLLQVQGRNRSAFRGGATFASIITSSMLNQRNNGGGEDQMKRLARLAEQTGTIDLLLKTVDDQLVAQGGSPSSSLLLRTALGRPEIAKEWREIVLSKSIPAEYLNGWTMPIVVDILGAQPDAAKLLPAYLSKIPENQYAAGGAEVTLASLADTLPMLAKYRSDPAIDKHIKLLVAKSMSDPNSSQYLLFSQSYLRALSVLLEKGYIAEAGQLFDRTAAARASQNYGNRPAWSRIEETLRVLQGQAVSVQVMCSGFPSGQDRLIIRWKVGMGSQIASENDSDAWPIWDDTEITIPRKSRPTTIEIYAGANAASLKKVGSVSQPGTSGAVEAKGLAPLGLLQARWVLPDGSDQWGPLTVYLLAENRIANQGIPEKSALVFTRDQPGPLGEKSAVGFQGSSPRPEYNISFGDLTLDGSRQTVVLAGWIRGDSNSGSMPSIKVAMIEENGRTQNDELYLGNSSGAEWRQFVQVWAPDGERSSNRNISAGTRRMVFTSDLRASNGYNSLYSFRGAWDGLQLISFQETSGGKVRELIAEARKEAQDKNFKVAADRFLEALRANPGETLQQGSSSMIDTFTKAGRLNEFFSFLSAPALYQPNPLFSNRPAMQNTDLIGTLAREALGSKAPEAAKGWLKVVANAPLNDQLQFVVQAALLQDEIARDPKKANAEKILSILGFAPAGPNRERIRQLWVGSRSSLPTVPLLEIVDQQKMNVAVAELLAKAKAPIETMASQQMLLAWLNAPGDPARALDQWRQSLTLRETQGGSFSDDIDQLFLIRLARSHPSPGDFIASVKSWLARKNADSSQRRLMEILYTAASLESPRQQEYAALWAEAELASLKSPDYQPSRDRIRELAKRLMDAGDWTRLENLLAVSKTNSTLKTAAIQREFEQLRTLVAVARGDLSQAWPIAWCEPGTNSQKVSVHWQWNIKDRSDERGRYDNVVSLSEKPVLPEIEEQQAIEIAFGELPSEMKTVARFEGKTGTGAVLVELPARNGFLRAIAILGDKRVPGPMVPVLSGRRIYPPAGATLKSMLTSGGTPVSAQNISDVGTAPDGSPAVRIGAPGQREATSYDGPDFAVQAEKFYVVRAWQKRAGDGSGSLGSVIRGGTAAGSRNTVNMLLSENEGTTGQWVLYSRAVPVLPQHTFWVPFQSVEAQTPNFRVPPGTEIAGWELLEIQNWKYAQWIIDLAMLRQNAGKDPEKAVIERAAALATIEPLTALDYHGEWLVTQMLRVGSGAELAKLYQAALVAEANPLFSRPKLNRIFNSLVTAINDSTMTDDVRWEAIQVGRANLSRAGGTIWFGLQARYLTEARKRGQGTEALATVRKELQAILADSDKAPEFLKSVITSRNLRDGRHSSRFLDFIAALDDAETVRMLQQGIKDNRDANLESYDKAFLSLAVEAGTPGQKFDANWQELITKALALTEKASAPNSFMVGPSVLGEVLIAHQAPSGLILHLRELAFQRMLFDRLVKSGEDNSGSTDELLRAGWLLIEAALKQENKDVARSAAERLITPLRAKKGKFTDESLRLALRSIDLLTEADLNEQAVSLLQVVEKDACASTAVSESFAKYLAPKAN